MGFPTVWKGWLRGAAVVGLLCAAAPSLAAQETGTVRGRVVSSGAEQPLSGARVSVAGTTQGTVTGPSGEYTLTGIAPGNVRLTASQIGRTSATRSVTVAAGATVRADFVLAEQALSLDALVVTGTPGAVARRSVGNAVTQIDVADVTQKTSVVNVTEVLQARSPGVQILTNSGVPGTSSEIRIRGAGSFIGNQPVVYVDGVRYNIESLGNFNPSGGGATSFSGQVTSGLNGLSPNDIESIEVIKGPAAATLYGAEAAGGVIQIITKRGTRGSQGLRWSARAEQGRTDWAVATPVSYTTCTQARVDSMNALTNAPVYPGCQGQTAGSVITSDLLRTDPNALRTGDLSRYSASVRGGGDKYSFYVGGDLDREEGVFHNSFNGRRSVRANFVLNPYNTLDFAINTNYYRTHLRLPLGDESGNGILLSGARARAGRQNTNGVGWATVNPVQSNAYNNQTWTDRITLGTTVNYRPMDWFRNRLTVGMDITSSLAQLISRPDQADFPEGVSAQRAPRSHYYTVDYAGSVIRGLTRDLESTTSVGAQLIAKRDETLSATGTGLGSPDVTRISTATSLTGDNTFSENNSVGFFVQEQVAWRNRLFLTGAVRADDNSSFGTGFDWITYPKASLSWVLSEEPALESFFGAIGADNFKLRAAYGQAGRAPDPYTAVQSYTVDKVTLGEKTVNGIRTSAYGNPNLKPERGEEFELGFDLGIMDGRMGAEFTYYDKQMNDVIVLVALPPSGGFPVSRFENLGSTRNSGVELGLTGTPVRSRAFTWDTRVNLATNRNRLESFGTATKVFEAVGSQAYIPAGATVRQEHRAGYPLAGYWVIGPQRDENGNIKYNAAGTAVVLDSVRTYGGTPVPTREVGFSNTFTLFQNLRVYSLFDYRGGHHLMNFKEYNRCVSNANCKLVNDPQATPQEIARARSDATMYLERADFVKLRDLSLTYTLPSRVLRVAGASDLSFTLAGHNLALWSDYSGLDPEVNTGANRSFVRTDAYAAPMTRRYSVSVNLSY